MSSTFKADRNCRKGIASVLESVLHLYPNDQASLHSIHLPYSYYLHTAESLLIDSVSGVRCCNLTRLHFPDRDRAPGLPFAVIFGTCFIFPTTCCPSFSCFRHLCGVSLLSENYICTYICYTLYTLSNGHHFAQVFSSCGRTVLFIVV